MATILASAHPTVRIFPGQRWLPSLCDCFLVAVVVWLFLAGPSGWKALLMDGDTGWHIRTGEYILNHGRVPAQDLFSFSRPGAPWFAWEWLSDICFGILFRIAGLKGVVLFAGIVIALYATVLLRYSIWKGANVMVALPLTLLAVGSSTMHFLARPHIFTLLLLPLCLWIIERDRQRQDRWLWLLVPLTAVWANLHGGFAVFLVLIALLVIGTLLESWWMRRRGGLATRYAALLACCCLATVLNPFGLGLDLHIVQYLQADWIRNMVQEFQSPTFRSEGQFQFEMLLLLGVMVSAHLLTQKAVTESLWILFLAHSALTSVRHAPLYSAVAMPLIAVQLSILWARTVEVRQRSSVSGILYQLGSDIGPMFRAATVWAVFALTVVGLIDAPIPWPTDFPKEAFPVGVLSHHTGTIRLAKRVLSSDQWGDYLIYSFPDKRVFIDGRTDFYGEKVSREYFTLLQGGASWKTVMDKYDFDLVLIPADWPLASLLKSSSTWRVVEDDGQAILFSRSPKQVVPDFPKPHKDPNGTGPFSRSL